MTAEPLTPADDYFSAHLKGREQRHHRRKESSSDAEDRPLEMTPLRHRTDNTVTDRRRRRSSHGRGSIKRLDTSGRKSPVATRKGELIRLPSDTDLLARRMVNLTGTLLGKGSGTESP
jgi:hypothetical protein